MEILSESFEANFNGKVTLEGVEKLFEERKIKPFRWAITEIDPIAGVLKIDYSAIKVQK